MEPVLIVSATVLVVALALLATQSRVPGGHVGMVLRGGRVVRVATAGQRVVALPLVDTVRWSRSRPRHSRSRRSAR